MSSVYLIGSLRNPKVPELAKAIRKETTFDVFDCWFAAGERADDHWQEYANGRGQTYEEALRDYPAQHVLNYDRRHLERCDAAVLVMPAGKSGHLELGYFIGRRAAIGLPVNAFIYFETFDPKTRYDVMYGFATRVCIGQTEIIESLTALGCKNV